MDNCEPKNNRRKILSIIIGVLLVSMAITYFTELEQVSYFRYFLIALSICSVVWTGSVILFKIMNHFFPGFKNTGKRLILSFLLAFIYTFLSVNVVKLLFGIISFSEATTFKEWTSYVFMSWGILIVVALSYESVGFYQSWKKSLIRAEQAEIQILKSQLQTLTTQTNPHFLFNSLNTLISLIEEDPKSAVKYTTKLSDYYRYIVSNKSSDLVDIKHEIRAAKDYIDLQSIRFNEGIKLCVDEKLYEIEKQLPPLTLQILIENVVKHNVITKNKSVQIEMKYNEQGFIHVINNINKKINAVDSTRTGLENIKERFKFFSKDEVKIKMDSAFFEVLLPLI